MASSFTETNAWGKGQYAKKISLAVVTSADGTVSPNVSTTAVEGWVTRVTVVPGSPAPQANYDISMLDSDDAVLSGTSLNDNSSTTATSWVCDNPIYITGALQFAVTNNNVSSAAFTINVYAQR